MYAELKNLKFYCGGFKISPLEWENTNEYWIYNKTPFSEHFSGSPHLIQNVFSFFIYKDIFFFVVFYPFVKRYTLNTNNTFILKTKAFL